MSHRILYLAFTLITGCAPNIEFSRRSANEPVLPTIPLPPSVIVSSSSTPSESSQSERSQPTITNVGLTLFKPKASDIAEILKGLEKVPEPPKFNSNRTVLKRTVIATVSKGDYRPADRFVNFRLRITPKNFSFTEYTGVKTDYTEINIGTLEIKKINSTTGKITGGKPIATELGFSSEKSVSESGEVSTRIENTTVNLEGPTLDIYREAERGVDQSGNTLVNISVTALREQSDQQIKFDDVVTAIEISKDGKWISQNKASLKTSLLQHLAPIDLKADVSFEYVMRRVISKSNEYPEHNQIILLEKGSCTQQDALIVNANDFSTPLWKITNGQGIVQLKTNTGFRQLNFTDPVIASEFLEWMIQEKAVKIGKQELRLQTLKENVLDSRKEYPQLRIFYSGPVTDKPAAVGKLICNSNPTIYR